MNSNVDTLFIINFYLVARTLYSFSNAFSLDKTLKGYDPIAVDGSDIYVDEMYGQYVKGAAEVTKAGLTSFIK